MSNWWDPVTGWVYGAGKAITQPVVTPIVQAIESSHIITPTQRPIASSPEPVAAQPVQQPRPMQGNQVPLNPISATIDPFLNVPFGVGLAGTDILTGGAASAAFPKEAAAYQEFKAPITQAVQQRMPLNQQQYAAYRDTMHSKWSSINPSDIISVAAFEVGDIFYKNPMAPIEYGMAGVEAWAAWETVGLGAESIAARGGFGSKAAKTALKVMQNPWTSRALVAGSYAVSTYFETEGFSHGWGGNIAGGAKVATEFGMMAAPFYAMQGAPYAYRGIKKVGMEAYDVGKAYKNAMKTPAQDNWGVSVANAAYTLDEFMLVKPSQMVYPVRPTQVGEWGTGINWGKRWNGKMWVKPEPIKQLIPEDWGQQVTIEKPRPTGVTPVKMPQITALNTPSRLVLVQIPRTKWDLKTTTKKQADVIQQLQLLVSIPPPKGTTSAPPPTRRSPLWVMPPTAPPIDRTNPKPPIIPPMIVFPTPKPFRIPPIAFPGGVGGSSGENTSRRMREAWKHRNKVAAQLPAFFYNINAKKGNKKKLAKLFG